jgi:hypothetical protein
MARRTTGRSRFYQGPRSDSRAAASPNETATESSEADGDYIKAVLAESQ